MGLLDKLRGTRKRGQRTEGTMDPWNAGEKDKRILKLYENARPIEPCLHKKLDLTREDIDFLNNEFLFNTEMELSLSKKIIEYIKDGKNSNVLMTLSDTRGVGDNLWLTMCDRGKGKAWEVRERRVKFFQQERNWDPEFLYRMAMVYHAAAMGDSEKEIHWLTRFLLEMRAVPFLGYFTAKDLHPTDVHTILGMLKCAGEGKEQFASIAIPGFDKEREYHGRIVDSLQNLNKVMYSGSLHKPVVGATLTGFNEFVMEYEKEIGELLMNGRFDHRFFLCDLMKDGWIDPAPWRPILAQATIEHLAQNPDISSAMTQQVEDPLGGWVPVFETEEGMERTYRMMFLRASVEIILPWIIETAQNGSIGERCEAFRNVKKLRSIHSPLLTKWFDMHLEYLNFTDLIDHRNKIENDPSVREVINTMVVREDPDHVLYRDADSSSIPESREGSNTITPVSPEVRNLIVELIDGYNDHLKKERENYLISEEKKEAVVDWFMNVREGSGQSISFDRPVQYRIASYQNDTSWSIINAILDHPTLGVIHLARFHRIFGIGLGESPRFWNDLVRYRNAHGNFLDLRDLSAAFTTVGMNPFAIQKTMLTKKWSYAAHWYRTHAEEWTPEEIWPFLSENLQPIKEIFFLDGDPEVKQMYGWRGSDNEQRANALMLLSMFPEPPEFFVPLLWELSLGNSKMLRGPARTCLAHFPDIEDQILGKLSSKNSQERAGAARWLADIGSRTAISPIKKALGKERIDGAKIAMIDALEALGVPEEEYLNRKGLLKEAQKSMGKGIPDQLSWFPFDLLPEVHWKDSGKQIDREIIPHFILQAYKLKKPEPSALLRRYVGHMNIREKEKLGQFVLEHWINRDTSRKYSPVEEKEFIMNEIRQYNRTSSQKELEELYEGYVSWEENTQLLQGATKEKGILAIAGACCGVDAVLPIENYLKKYYGWRASQCKSLIAVLSWIDDYTAIGLLIRTSERFRTPSIRKEAENLVRELAERKGWSLDELSDRILPTGGFDAHGEQIIGFGQRSITVKVDRNMKVHLFNENGKEIRSPHASRSLDDEDAVKEGKRLLSSANKAVKEITKREPTRLYDAMCTQRTWRFRDWDRYLNRHPIMTHYCQQVIWAVFEEDADNEEESDDLSENSPLTSGLARVMFRPLDDHSLTDQQDNEVHLEDDAIIRVAHSLTIPSEQRDAWIKHLRDYRITPLIIQFPLKIYRLPEDLTEATGLEMFKGYVIEGYTLDRTAKKLGYVAGPRDGTYYNNYVKKLIGPGLEIHLEVSGIEIDLRDEKTAIMGLSFAGAPEEWEDESNVDQRKIPLGNINPILVSEGYDHLKQIAEKGNGFDPEWEKKYCS